MRKKEKRRSRSGEYVEECEERRVKETGVRAALDSDSDLSSVIFNNFSDFRIILL